MVEPIRPDDVSQEPPIENQFVGWEQAPAGDDPGPMERDWIADVQATDKRYVQFLADVHFRGVTGEDVQYPCGQGNQLQGVPAEPGKVVKKHTGFVEKVVTWTAERENDWPTCPHPVTDNPNEILVDWEITPAQPLNGPDGLRAFRISGIYRYKLVRGLSSLTLPTMLSPSSNAQMGDQTVPVIVFDRSLLATTGHQGDA